MKNITFSYTDNDRYEQLVDVLMKDMKRILFLLRHCTVYVYSKLELERA